MAANDELPRGCSLGNFAGGGVAVSITIPAVAGVVHVIDEVIGELINATGAAAFATQVAVTGVYTFFELAISAAVAGTVDRASWTGPQTFSGVGQSILIAAQAAPPAGYQQNLIVKFHDI